MLTKAILTGGALSVLTGFIVYFGTEGADASESEARTSVRAEQTELAGAPDVNVGNVVTKRTVTETTVVETTEVQEDGQKDVEIEEVRVAEANVQDPPPESSKPKTKWLDQYLKKSKAEDKSETPEKASEETADTTKSEKETSSATTYETGSDAVEGMGITVPDEAYSDPMAEEPSSAKTYRDRPDRAERGRTSADAKDKARKRIKKRQERQERMGGLRGEDTGTYVVSKDSGIRTLHIDGLDLEALNAEGDVDIDAVLEELGLGSEENVEIRVVKKMSGKPSRPDMASDRAGNIDYDMVLDEAKKLLVTDMRNQAYLEIVDHAIDQGDVMRAADIVDDLSTPELRDTARARIGVGLARSGDTEAAFAVLEELEIDELSAPIRLEIITALMATKQERGAFGSQ